MRASRGARSSSSSWAGEALDGRAKDSQAQSDTSSSAGRTNGTSRGTSNSGSSSSRSMPLLRPTPPQPLHRPLSRPTPSPAPLPQPNTHSSHAHSSRLQPLMPASPGQHSVVCSLGQGLPQAAQPPALDGGAGRDQAEHVRAAQHGMAYDAAMEAESGQAQQQRTWAGTALRRVARRAAQAEAKARTRMAGLVCAALACVGSCARASHNMCPR